MEPSKYSRDDEVTQKADFREKFANNYDIKIVWKVMSFTTSSAKFY